ncbi:MAG: class I SAM-dependent methyltransferase [Gammaproteobacteria bacterium]
MLKKLLGRAGHAGTTRSNTAYDFTGDRFVVHFDDVPGARTDIARTKFDAYVAPLLAEFAQWARSSRETTNFTYDLAPLDYDYLAHTLAVVCGRDPATMAGFVDEVRQDAELADWYREARQHVPQAVRLDDQLRLGRRVGWYAAARALKPALIVEAGVDTGIGALALLAALKRNAEEGHAARYVGIDISPTAGKLIGGPYADFAEMVHGDSVESLAALDGEVGMFVSDSDHSREYERREYETVAPRLTGNAIVIADNAHVTDELMQFAARSERRFLYFQENPRDHWFRVRPAGIGFAFAG